LDEVIKTLESISTRIEEILKYNGKELPKLAEQTKNCSDFYFIARGINYAIANEGALKLKEVSYIHAEGMSAGELKHGPFALLGSRTPVVAVVAQDNTYEPIITSIKEIKARHSPVLAIASEGDDAMTGLADFVINVPEIDPLFSPVVNTVALQLLAYYVARERGCPIDFPRNLAKSVTVE
jgi:glucosamine--fructose-6-phosphate aminotransferase (isomerizing)